jgi:hypothetical protein
VPQTDRSYYAGFLDGEGSVSIDKTRKTNGRQIWQLVVSISNRNPRALLEMHRRYGGSLIPRYKTGRRGMLWQFGLCTGSASRFLSDLLPYLRLKKRQALLALEFQREVSKRFGAKYNHHGLSGSEIAIRERFYRKVCQLNGRFNMHGGC